MLAEEAHAGGPAEEILMPKCSGVNNVKQSLELENISGSFASEQVLRGAFVFSSVSRSYSWFVLCRGCVGTVGSEDEEEVFH